MRFTMLIKSRSKMKIILIFGALCVAFLHSDVEARNIENKIIGGETAPEGIAPYQASLVVNLYHFCGACILNSRWVLTAEHCLYNDDTSVSVGSNHLDRPYVVIKATRKIGHPEHDIGLVQVESDFPFQSTIQPINLPTGNLPDGAPIRLTGWGANIYENGQSSRIDALQMLDTFSVSQADCSLIFGDVFYERDLCTFKNNGQGACFGDSGSPYVSNGEVHAVTSRVVPCAVGYPDLNTRVFTHVPWILNEMSKYK